MLGLRLVLVLVLGLLGLGAVWEGRRGACLYTGRSSPPTQTAHLHLPHHHPLHQHQQQQEQKEQEQEQKEKQKAACVEPRSVRYT